MRKLILFVVLAAVALNAAAQMEGMQPIVAPDGTILVTRPALASDAGMTTDLIAVSPAGTTLWTWQSVSMMHSLAFRDARVFVATRPVTPASHPMMGRGSAGDDELVALSLQSGAVQWRRELAGLVFGIETTADRVYVVIRDGDSTTNGMMSRGRGMQPRSGDATLVALDAATGTVLWSLALR